MMKKVNVLLMALAMMLAFTACSDDDDDNKKIDESALVINKQHDNALLLVTFGSTWDAPHKTYKKMVAAYRKAFPNKDVYLSFTSTICITRWNAKTGELYVTPDVFLNNIAAAGYKNIVVQSCHVIPGEEYLLLKDTYVANFKKTHPNIPVVLGDALLATKEDVRKVGDVLYNAFKPKLAKGELLLLMGHGNPKPEFINEGAYNVNANYEELEKYLQAKNGKNIYVGTVDYEPTLIPAVLAKMKKDKVAKGSIVNLTPLMSIAGDHANNDMAGDIEEGVPADEQSWKVQLRDAGYTIKEDNCILKGLGDYPAIVNIWIQHTKDAIAK